MSSERDIEKQLRDYAEQRRKQAGPTFEMHPATRRLLQDEVLRRAPKPEPEEISVPLWQWLRLRWAFLAGFTLVVFLGATLLWPVLNRAKPKEPGASKMVSQAVSAGAERGKLVSATSETRAQLQPAPRQPESAIAVPGLNAGSPSKLSGATSEIASVERPEMALPAPTVPGVGTSAVYAIENTVNKSGFAANLPTAPAVPTASPPPLANDLAATQELFYQNVLLTQAAADHVVASQFKAPREQTGAPQMETLSKQSAEPTQLANVLSQFEVEQSGDFIRILDRDGSVYSGTVQPANAVAQSETTAPQMPAAPLAQTPEQAAVPAGGSRPVSQGFAFRVVGMNRTFGQSVVFVGNLITISKAPVEAHLNTFSSFGFAGGRQPAVVPSQPLILSNSRIAGTAVIGGTNQIEINALPATP